MSILFKVTWTELRLLQFNNQTEQRVKILWMLMPLFLIGNIAAQDLIERKQAEDQKHLLKYRSIENDLFSIDKSFKKKADYNEVYLKLNQTNLKKLKNNKVNQLAIPVSAGHYIDLILEPTEIYAPGGSIFNSEGQDINREKGQFFKGYVADDPKSRISLSVFDRGLQLNIADSEGNYNLSFVEKSNNYVLFNDQNLGTQPFTCKNDELNFDIPEKIKKSVRQPGYKSNECIKIYIETDYTTYVNFNSDPQQVLDFVEGAFLEVANIYASIGLTIKLSDIKIWTSPDNYGADGNVGSALTKVSNAVPQFNGDIMHLISATGDCCGWSGVAYVNYNPNSGKFNGSTVCGANPYGVSQTSLSYQNLPVYSWTVNVLAHEIGHNLGAPHTHECIWGPNYNQSLDACVPAGASCGNPGIPSTGTIMSYCHTRSDVGISLDQGFHPLVAQHLLAENQNRACLTPCSPVSGCTEPSGHGYNPIATIEDGSCAGTCSDGILNGDEEAIDCGGTLCNPCPIICDGTLFYVDLTFDRYAEETSWNLTNFNGEVILEGGPYVGQPDGSSESVPLCLEDGEYTFTIYDTYGDGICCEYGSGLYRVVDDNGVEIMSGGDFGSEESTVFIVSSPSCDDGIQNGDEEGVDCGGSCAPCEVILCENELIIVESKVWDFEEDNWQYLQDQDDELEFISMTGGTPSVATGPTTPANGKKYIYIESSSPNYPSKVGQLIIECVDLSQLAQAGMEFSYHMYGARMGSLKIVAISQKTNEADTIWTIEGDQGNEWHRAKIDLSLYQDYPVDLIIIAETGTHYTSDIAIDHLIIGESNLETCYDGILNGDEEDIDCGGSSCEPCKGCQMDDFTFSDNLNYINVPDDIVVKNRIISEGNVTVDKGSEMSWQAGESIEIGPGFEVNAGAAITLKTAACVDSDESN